VYVNRTVPQVEIEAVSQFLFHLLTGDVDKLPTETLVHSFWNSFYSQQTQAAKYFPCLQKHKLIQAKCYSYIGSYCGTQFGQKPTERIEQCRRLLANEISVTTAGLNETTAQMFNKYHSCIQSYRRRVHSNCTEVLRKTIIDHRLRATKVVRATMDSMRPLLRALPNLRVIHLVRDPRAVALSRIRFDPSGRGAYTKNIRTKESPVVAEASQYCHHVTTDIRFRLALEREFPGRILSMRYEDVVANPEQRFRDIYKLLDEPLPNATLAEMQKKAKSGQAKNLTTKWQSKLTFIEAVTIAQHCADFFRLMNLSPIDTLSWISISKYSVNVENSS